MTKKRTLNIINTILEVLEHLSFIIALLSIALLVTYITAKETEIILINLLNFTFIFIIIHKIAYGSFTVFYRRTSTKGVVDLAIGIIFLALYFFTEYVLSLKTSESLTYLIESFSVVLKAVIYLLYLFINKEKILTYLKTIKLNPAQSFSLGFILVIFIGTWLLSLPFATNSPVAFIDRLFTATSAVCVTGLVTIDITTSFTLFGKIIILILIQVGALGIMGLMTFLIIFSGKKLDFYERNATLAIFNQDSFVTLKRLIILMIIFTLSVEIIGAVLIFFSSPPGPFLEKAFFSIFHSVSAFCNAGFSTLPDSLMSYYSSFNINMTISMLIIIGGLGFPVILNLKEHFIQGKKITLHTKIVLLTSIFLIIAGTLMFLGQEYHHTLANYSAPEKALTSFFQSVSTRTAGFNTIPMNELQPTTIMWMVVFMFIGASPGSTGGGLKTTTFFILIYAVIVFLKKSKTATVFKRKIRLTIFHKAGLILIVRGFIVILATILLMYYETRVKFLDLLFEVVSAFSTVGLTTGITSLLSNSGKIIIILLMFIGRLGPLNILASMASKKPKGKAMEYSDGYIIVG